MTTRKRLHLPTTLPGCRSAAAPPLRATGTQGRTRQLARPSLPSPRTSPKTEASWHAGKEHPATRFHQLPPENQDLQSSQEDLRPDAAAGQAHLAGAPLPFPGKCVPQQRQTCAGIPSGPPLTANRLLALHRTNARIVAMSGKDRGCAPTWTR